jgi:hypothetical protein
MKRFTKQQLINFYTNKDFPEDKISQDAKNLKEILFEENENKRKFIDETMLYGNLNGNRNGNITINKTLDINNLSFQNQSQNQQSLLSECFYEKNKSNYKILKNENYNKQPEKKYNNNNWRNSEKEKEKNKEPEEDENTENFNSFYNNNNTYTKNNINNNNNNQKYKGKNFKENPTKNKNNYFDKKLNNDNYNKNEETSSLIDQSSSFNYTLNTLNNNNQNIQDTMLINTNKNFYNNNINNNHQKINLNLNTNKNNKKYENPTNNPNPNPKLNSIELIVDNKNNNINNIDIITPNKKMKKKKYEKYIEEIENNNLFDTMIKEEIDNQNILFEKENMININANEIENIKLSNFSKNIINKNSEENQNLNHNKSQYQFQNSSLLDFKKIYEINKALLYPENKPLWYILHSETNSSFGPLSTKQMEKMYLNNEINELIKVRFIDFIKFKNKANFEFVPIIDLIKIEILNEIEMSGLFKSLSTQLNSITINEVKKIQMKPVVKNTVNMKNYKAKMTKNLEKEKEKNLIGNGNLVNRAIGKGINSNNPNLNHNNLDENEEYSEINNLIYQQINNIDNEDNLINENKKLKALVENKTIKPEISFNNLISLDSNAVADNNKKIIEEEKIIVVGKKKGKRGNTKKENLNNIKTGFFTMTEQEKNVNPVYIVGDFN